MKSYLWLVLVNILKFFDILTTYLYVSKVGVIGELNPIIKFAMIFLGIEWGLLLAFLINFALFLWLYKRNSFKTIIFGNFLLFGVIINNFIVLLR